MIGYGISRASCYGRFHFQQLADDNEATEAHVDSVIKLDSKTAVPRLP